MTALNMWEDGRNAYILNDTSVYPVGGSTLLRTKFKTIVVDGLAFDQRVAIALTGCLMLEVMAAAIEEMSAITAGEIVENLPAMMMRMTASLCERQNYDEKDGYMIALAIVDPALTRPILMIAESECARNSGHNGLPANRLHQVRYWTTANTPFGPFTCQAASYDPAAIAAFDPQRDGLAMMDFQRDDPELTVGGAAVLTTIGPDGAYSETLTTWPDVVGQPINAQRG